MPCPAEALRAYFHAKDENRPLLIARAFATDATLEVRNRSEAIAFPAHVAGREAIADVLVRRFGQTYENIRSFYLDRPPVDATQFRCEWLVAMTDKATRGVRVGAGSYDWTFDPVTRLATHLVITIDAMQVLPAEATDAVFAWVDGLDYPWSSSAAVLAPAPALAALRPVLDTLRRGAG